MADVKYSTGNEDVITISIGKRQTSKLMNIETFKKNLDGASKYFVNTLNDRNTVIYDFLNKKVRKIMLDGIKRRFSTETDPEGKKWVPLSKYTIQRKTEKGTLGKGILRDSGKMRNSIRVRAPKDGEIEQVASTGYAWIHQPPDIPYYYKLTTVNGIRGISIPTVDMLDIPDEVKEHMPAEIFVPTRAFMGFDDESGTQINKAIDKQIRDIITKFFKNLIK